MNIVILGCGYLGYNYAKYFLSNNINTLVFTRSSNEYTELLKSDYSVTIITDKIDYLEQFLNNETIVIYTIGSSNAQSSLDIIKNELELVYKPFIDILEYCSAKEIKKFIFISSGGTVYGNCDADTISENIQLMPINIYGLQKGFFENLIRIYGLENKLKYLILRVSNPFGGYQSDTKSQGIIPIMIRKALKNEPISLWVDPDTTIRDFIYIEDLLYATDKLIKIDNNLCLNIGSGEGISLSKVIQEVQQYTKSMVLIKKEFKNSLNINRVVLDISNLKSNIPNFKTIDFSRAVEKTVEEEKKYKNK